MENTLVQIKNAIIRILKQLDPGTDVFFEEIKSTDAEHGLDRDATYYFVDIVPNISDTVDRYFTDRVILVDVAYHEANESNTAYLAKTEELDGAIRPVFSFGDRHITVPKTSWRISDHVLHCSFTLSFRLSRGETAALQEKMGELEMAAGKGE